jgi:NADP-dependent aldehyde dehydrogenase
MTITGKLLINGEWIDGQAGTYHAVDPATGQELSPSLSKASIEQVKQAVAAAEAASSEFRRMPLQKRAGFLRACAEEIMALGETLVVRAMAETGLPKARIEGERGRTCGQLNLFADTILTGEFLDVRIDTALPDRQPLPRLDLRYMNQAIGPVVVFGASNFPLAFSVAGGDTASALAAGCPVLVKGHSSHPGTSELVAQAIARAARSTAMPAGVFSLLMGSGREVGSALVSAPEVKAVGFTGSFAGGMTLVRLAAERPEPIPVFTEMGSLNPVVLLPEAL